MHKTLIFFGNERLATGVATDVPLLNGLIEAGYQIAAVVSNYHPSDRQLEIKEIADAHHIPLLLPDKLSDIISVLQNYNAEVGVLAAYGKIVPQSVIDIFPKGIVNIHPSLLPLHRGPTPIESVILNSEQKTGVSLMQLAAKMDAGPVFARSEISLTGNETKQALADILSEIATAMLLDRLPSIISGEAVAVPQEDSLATYDKLISKTDGNIDWRKPAKQIEREIRAYAGWPKSRTQLGEVQIIITGAHEVPSLPPGTRPGEIEIVTGADALMIATGSGALCIERLVPAGKKEMTAAEFIRGYSSKIGSL